MDMGWGTDCGARCAGVVWLGVVNRDGAIECLISAAKYLPLKVMSATRGEFGVGIWDVTLGPSAANVICGIYFCDAGLGSERRGSNYSRGDGD